MFMFVTGVPGAISAGFLLDKLKKFKIIGLITSILGTYVILRFGLFLSFNGIPVLFQGSAYSALILWRRLFECDKRFENPPHEALGALKTPLK